MIKKNSEILWVSKIPTGSLNVSAPECACVYHLQRMRVGVGRCVLGLGVSCVVVTLSRIDECECVCVCVCMCP